MGDRLSLLQRAAQRIAQHPAVASLQASRIFTTPPVGGPQGQRPFYNAAAVIQTELSTEGVLHCLQTVEHELGRVRKTRWDQRLIDLDVVLFGDFLGQSWRLKLPHPRYSARAFVLTPAVDVAPQWQDPRFAWTLKQLHEHLQRAPASISLVGGSMQTRRQLGEQLCRDHGIAFRANDAAMPEMTLRGHAPGNVSTVADVAPTGDESHGRVDFQQPWVADFVPEQIFKCDPEQASRDPSMPRLIARLASRSPQSLASQWPSPQVIYRNRWNWPEYSLEIDDPSWAVGELAAAIESMRCEVIPVTDDGNWWKLANGAAQTNIGTKTNTGADSSADTEQQPTGQP